MLIHGALDLKVDQQSQRSTKIVYCFLPDHIQKTRIAQGSHCVWLILAYFLLSCRRDTSTPIVMTKASLVS